MTPFLTGPLAIAAALFLILLAILWFVLPFAIFGIKPILREQAQRQDEILRELRSLKSTSEAKTGVFIDPRDPGRNGS